MSGPPVALTIAGSDCCAGAGIQADLKTFSLLGVHGVTAVSAVVSETPWAVHGTYHLSPTALQEQIRILLDSYPVATIKTGLLGSAPHVTAVAELLEGREQPLVVDPVLGSSTGTIFASKDVIRAYCERLLPIATLVTPNLPEAERLLVGGVEPGPPDKHPALGVARQLAQELGITVLLTGGHSIWNGQATDIFCHREEVQYFSHPKIDLPGAHGTGCAYSAAITGFLARGLDMRKSIAEAKAHVTRLLQTSYTWTGVAPDNSVRTLNQLPDTIFDSGESK